MLTGTCSWNGQEYLGVADFRVALEYAPASLASRDLPAAGTCSTDSFLFAEEAHVQGGSPIPKLDGTPAWSARRDSGQLTETEPGLWFEDVYRHHAGGCGKVDEVAGDGISLVEAGVFSGHRHPDPRLPRPRHHRRCAGTTAGRARSATARPWTWPGRAPSGTRPSCRCASGNGPNLRDVVTCNTTGTSSKALDSAFWKHGVRHGRRARRDLRRIPESRGW